MGFSLDAATSSGISWICCETALIGRLQFHDGVHTDQTHMLHGAGICTPTFARTKSPSHVGKYTSTMDHLGDEVEAIL